MCKQSNCNTINLKSFKLQGQAVCKQSNCNAINLKSFKLQGQAGCTQSNCNTINLRTQIDWDSVNLMSLKLNVITCLLLTGL